MQGIDYGMGIVTIEDDTIEYTKDPMLKEDLPENGVFVFASNKQGAHAGGSAYFAHTELGAEWGVGEGPTGRCYAFPTLNFGKTQFRENSEKFEGIDSKVTFEELVSSWKKFVDYVEQNPDKKFYVTKVGLGIAGFDLFTIHKSFWDAGIPFLFSRDRVVYPIDFEMPDDAIKNW